MHGVEFSQGRLKKMKPNDALFRLAEETGVKKAKQQVGSRLL
jgi:aspartate 4-decarboxylase